MSARVLVRGLAVATGCLAATLTLAQGARDETARASAPVDLTGYWVSVITEDWAWRMQTPPRGDYASVPLNEEGIRVTNQWREADEGSCLAFGAAALLRMPVRLRIAWEDDNTLKIDADNGEQTRLLRFGDSEPTGARSLQGYSRAEWELAASVTGSGATGGVLTTELERAPWGTLKVVTTNMSAAWLRPNGVPYSENAVMTEYFDVFEDGDQHWFTATTMVEDPTYLTETFVISSNFKREPDGSKWHPRPCRS
jgi:hypothetical protein